MTTNQARKFLKRIKKHVEKAEEIYVQAEHSASDSDGNAFSDFVGWDVETGIQNLLADIQEAEEGM